MTEFPPPEKSPVDDIALNAVAYGNPDTALETFVMLEAAQLILRKMNGEPIDEDRLARLQQALHREPELDMHYDYDTGEEVYTDDGGDEVRREPMSPGMLEVIHRHNARKQMVSDFVAERAPQFLSAIHHRLEAASAAGPHIAQTALSILVKRGGDGSLVSPNELEIAALDHTRDTLREQGFTVREDHRRVGADGLPEHPKKDLTHSKHILRIHK